MDLPLPPRSRLLLRLYVQKPYLTAARSSPALRRYCDRFHHLTPHFTYAEMADTQSRMLPPNVREDARKHCFNLERLKHRLGGISIHIDGPYRTREHNNAIHGAIDSRHVHGDATDHFAATVDGWVKASPVVNSRLDVLKIAEEIFTGVGNENSGTLHVDSRPGPKVRFVTWIGAR